METTGWNAKGAAAWLGQAVLLYLAIIGALWLIGTAVLLLGV